MKIPKGKNSYEKFVNEVLTIQKKHETDKKTPGTPDDGYEVDYSELIRKPKIKYKAKGGRVEYKSGGGVGCAKKGFNKKILKKGKK